jgi:non-heme chloroperoxidase
MTAALIFLLCVPAFAKVNAKSENFRTSDGVSLHYFDAGRSDAPAIVFIPGWTMAADIFEPQINGLQKDFRVVALDPRSQGDSEKTNDGNTLERRALDTKELIDHLHLKDVTLVGWSNGVPDVITFTEVNGTSQLRGIVLVDGFVNIAGEQLRGGMNGMLKAFQANRTKFTDGFVRSMYASKPTSEYIEHVKQQAMKMPTNTAVTDMFNVVSKADFMPALAKIDKPILYICEEQLEAQGKLVQAAVPRARVEVMHGVAHALFVDDAERFNKLVAEFSK